jgi:hypothetical protein
MAPYDIAEPDDPNTLVVPFIFVPQGDPLPLAWMREHPDWIRVPATFVPRAPAAGEDGPQWNVRVGTPDAPAWGNQAEPSPTAPADAVAAGSDAQAVPGGAAWADPVAAYRRMAAVFDHPAASAGVVPAASNRYADATPPGARADVPPAAGAYVAGAMQSGLDRWSRYLAAAANLAEPDGGSVPAPVDANAVPGAATDIGATQAPPRGAASRYPGAYDVADAADGLGPAAPAPAAPVPGRYVAANPRQWIGHDSVGTGECVPLVRAATGAPRAADWQRGALVRGNAAVRPGTGIATFDDNGHYTGHAAILLWQDEHELHVIDQWNVRDPHGNITRHILPHERTLPFDDPTRTQINRGESYHVIE